MAANTINTVSINVARVRTYPCYLQPWTRAAAIQYYFAATRKASGGHAPEMGIVNWYLGLGLGQKLVVGLAVAVGLFLASYFATLVLLSSAPSDRSSPQAGASAPAITSPETSSPTPLPEAPKIRLKIRSARWEGEKAVAQGSWKGDVSSVHCDLLQGGSKGSVTDWWDRSVGTQMEWSGRTFTQDFVKAQGRKIEDPIEPTSRYKAVCTALFSGGWSVNDSAAVKGAPPG